ncbi:hypothetical protein DMUE_6045, partial [Dictyocoela muelleri]
TPKVSSLVYNHKILQQIDLCSEILINQMKITQITEIIKLIYSCQLNYFKFTHRPRPSTNWIDNINKQINMRKQHLNILNKYITQDGLDKAETELFRRICLQRRKKQNERYKPITTNELQEIAFQLENEIKLYEKRLEVHQNKKRFLRDNYLYECNRRKFYREISSEMSKYVSSIDKNEMLVFWKSQFKSQPHTKKKERKNLIETTLSPINSESPIDTSYDLIDEIINNLPNWKACGIDKIYNFFIKNLKSVRKILINELQRLCKNPSEIPEYLFTAITYMFPKKDTNYPSDFRPICCMSNIYKIITKILTKNLYNILEMYGVISLNQLGAKKNTLAAKEQVLFNH